MPRTGPRLALLVGPEGVVHMRQGVIRAERHVHMSPADLAHFGVKDGDYVKLRITGPCGVTFDAVKVREHPTVKLEVHIDTDEANASHIKTGDIGYIEGIQSRQ